MYSPFTRVLQLRFFSYSSSSSSTNSRWQYWSQARGFLTEDKGILTFFGVFKKTSPNSDWCGGRFSTIWDGQIFKQVNHLRAFHDRFRHQSLMFKVQFFYRSAHSGGSKLSIKKTFGRGKIWWANALIYNPSRGYLNNTGWVQFRLKQQLMLTFLWYLNPVKIRTTSRRSLLWKNDTIQNKQMLVQGKYVFFFILKWFRQSFSQRF